jgi:RNA polymerase sigma-70 factor, ECF subfamily
MTAVAVALHPIATARQDTPPMARFGERMAAPATQGSTEAADDDRLVAALREGDEDAFAEIVERYQPALLRVARMYARDRAVAEEVVQETWLAVLNGIDRFEQRSSFRTWLFRILTNRAKTRGERESRTVPFSALASEGQGDEAAVDADRFLPADHQHTPFAWAVPPRDWPEDRVLARETLDVVKDAISTLPEAQRTVITLRDIEGWSPEDVAAALEITDGNQRVLLHRARSKVRGALESYFDPELVAS